MAETVENHRNRPSTSHVSTKMLAVQYKYAEKVSKIKKTNSRKRPTADPKRGSECPNNTPKVFKSCQKCSKSTNVSAKIHALPRTIISCSASDLGARPSSMFVILKDVARFSVQILGANWRSARNVDSIIKEKTVWGTITRM